MGFVRRALWASLATLFGCGAAAPAPGAAPVVHVSAEESAKADENVEKQKEQPNKVAECNAMVGVINRAVDDLSKIANGAPGAAALYDYKALADTMDKAAHDMSKLDIKDKRLRGLSEDYQAMGLQIAKSARALITAAKDKNKAKVSAADADLQHASEREAPVVDAINQYCQEK